MGEGREEEVGSSLTDRQTAVSSQKTGDLLPGGHGLLFRLGLAFLLETEGRRNASSRGVKESSSLHD